MGFEGGLEMEMSEQIRAIVKIKKRKKKRKLSR